MILSSIKRTRGTAWAKRALASGMFVAALTSGLAAAPPAHAVTTTYTVNTTGDQSDLFLGDRTCDVDPNIAVQRCTLRAAIEQANADVDAGAINFNIPGTTLKTITPTEKLPVITDPVTIDGYTQPGASPNTLAKGTNAVLKIELNGDDQNNPLIDIRTDNSIVRGLVINRSTFSHIVIFDGTANKIEGNFIGTDFTGTQGLSSADGVDIREGSTNNTVGGTTPAARNLISGNRSGVGIGSNAGSDVTGNRVLGNLIGTRRDGTTALGNAIGGVFIRGASNFVGNGTSGGANVIAFNGAQGVVIDGTPGTVQGNRVLRNSIFSNGTLGIELAPPLGINPNDAGDADAGANEGQNFPVLSSAKTSSTKTTIAGKLNSTPNKTFKVQFFSNPAGTDEGKKFVGQKSITTDPTGNVSFTKTLPKVAAGKTITSTATDPAGNTSEFSAARKVE